MSLWAWLNKKWWVWKYPKIASTFEEIDANEVELLQWLETDGILNETTKQNLRAIFAEEIAEQRSDLAASKQNAAQLDADEAAILQSLETNPHLNEALKRELFAVVKKKFVIYRKLAASAQKK
jgi:hypothetical protein